MYKHESYRYEHVFALKRSCVDLPCGVLKHDTRSSRPLKINSENHCIWPEDDDKSSAKQISMRDEKNVE
jgi:hypothetical protein